MKINQLFRDKIPDDLFLKLLSCFDLESVTDAKSFNIDDLKKFGTVERIRQMLEDLKRYYIPCKARIYLRDMDEQSCITVLRQILRLFNKSLRSYQRYINGRKITFYSIHEEVATVKNTKFTQEMVRIEFA